MSSAEELIVDAHALANYVDTLNGVPPTIGVAVPSKLRVLADALAAAQAGIESRDAAIAEALGLADRALGKSLHRVLDNMILALRRAPVDIAAVRIHVSTYPDMETTARLHNEGFDEAMAQHHADDPGAADEWLEGVKAEARNAAFAELEREYTRDGSATGGEVREWIHEYRTTPTEGATP